MKTSVRNVVCGFFACVMACAAPAAADCYVVEPLVSDLPNGAPNLDLDLVDPWGMTFDGSGNLIVADSGASVVTSYYDDGSQFSFLINTPNSSPTGLERNRSNAGFFFTYNSQPVQADYIMTTSQGQILAYSEDADPMNAILVVDRSSNNAVYTGLALGSYEGQDRLFATDFFNGNVDVFDGAFNYLFSFTDTGLPAGYAPFNVREVEGNLYVSFALQNEAKNDAALGMGNGFINIFRADGLFLNPFVQQGVLNAPWGMTFAPKEFGQYGGAFLAGNFGNGTINAFDPATGDLLGQLTDEDGQIISIDGLRSLRFHRDDPKNVYYTADTNDQADGTVGRVSYYWFCWF